MRIDSRCHLDYKGFIQPFMPDAMGKLLDQLAVPADARGFAHLTKDNALKPGTPLPAPEGVFPRYVAGEGTPSAI